MLWSTSVELSDRAMKLVDFWITETDVMFCYQKFYHDHFWVFVILCFIHIFINFEVQSLHESWNILSRISVQDVCYFWPWILALICYSAKKTRVRSKLVGLDKEEKSKRGSLWCWVESWLEAERRPCGSFDIQHRNSRGLSLLWF